MVTAPEKGRRLGERVREIASTLLTDAKDPRIGFVTVTDVEMSKDNEAATIYYTVLPDTEEQRERTAAGLKSATGMVRRELGRVLHIRHTPEVRFTRDEVAESSRRIDAILDELGEEDR